MSNGDHYNLCVKAAKWLRSKNGCNLHYSVCEITRDGESPDAFGWGHYTHGTTHMIEVKVSRPDFLADAKKHFRRRQWLGVGELRWYMCPSDLIKPNELPEHWGLLYVNNKGKITEIVKPSIQMSRTKEEMNIISSVMRKAGMKPQTFNFKGVEK